MILKGKIAYTYWLKLYRKIAKPERFGIGEKIDDLLLNALGLMRLMRFAPLADKIQYIEKAIKQMDEIRFFSEIAWENKMMTTKEYSEFLHQLEEIGRELGGWKKGTFTKTPASR